VLAGCGGGRSAPRVPSLRGGAVPAGVSVRADLLGDSAYSRTVAAVFSSVTPENELKWETVEPQRGRFDFGPGDRVVGWARAHGLAVRGHTLVWHQQLPAWVRGADLRAHIVGEVRHYRGRIHEWDVVNEAVGDDGKLRPDVFLADLGPGYIARAFAWAHAADPGARLVYNDYGIEGLGPKSDAVYAMVRALLAQHVPIDAVGFQAHVDTTAVPGLLANLRRFAALGLDVELTETEVRLGDTQGDALHAQAMAYERLVAACRAVPRCTRITFWGLDDRDSFAPTAYPGFGRATLFDSSLRPKPAFFAVRRALRR
jgi:endo-1,4-beta-xylanase